MVIPSIPPLRNTCVFLNQWCDLPGSFISDDDKGMKRFWWPQGRFSFYFRKELLDQMKLTTLKGERSLQNGLAPLLRPNPGQAQLCLTLCDPMGCIVTRLLCPWNFPGKNTGVGCHSLLWGSSQPRNRTHVSRVSCTGTWLLYQLSYRASPEIYLYAV